MHHIDEHILELYVLNSPKVEHQRDTIDAHLNECLGCKKLVDEMRAFHEELGEELKQTPIPETTANTSLSKRKAQIEPYFEPYTAPLSSNAIVRSLQRFTIFVRNNPIKSTTGSMVTLGILALFINYKIETNKEAKNPVSFRFDMEKKAVVIYNDRDEELWRYGSYNMGDEKGLKILGASKIIINDLDADDRNEILTTFPNIEDESIGYSPLRIYDSERNLKLKHYFIGNFQYLTRTYYPKQFQVICLLVNELPLSKEKDIFVSTISIGRSPSALFRIDMMGNELGRYWHFGNIYFLREIDMFNNGHKQILIGGKNDCEDTLRNEFPFLAILDPTKIIGDKKSSATPGFHFDISDAELCYIRFPNTDLNEIFKVTNAISYIGNRDLNTLEVPVGINTTIDNFNEIVFHFFLSNSLRVIEVKSDNITDRFHIKLKEEGKTTKTINQEYLKELQHGVQYWDGEKWCNEWTMVRH